jgi:hypothetical protein
MDQNYPIQEKEVKSSIEKRIVFKGEEGEEGEEVDEYTCISKHIDANIGAICDAEEKVKAYKATCEDKKILSVYYFNVTYRDGIDPQHMRMAPHVVPVEQGATKPQLYIKWKDLYGCRDCKHLKQIRMEYVAYKEGNIEEKIKNNQGKLLTLLDYHKVKYILQFNKDLELRHSLDFTRNIPEQALVSIYERYKNDFERIKKLFNVRSIVGVENKSKFVASCFNCVYMDWSGVGFKAIDVARIREGETRSRVRKYALSKPNGARTPYDKLLQKDVIDEYVNACHHQLQIANALKIEY